MFQSDAQLTSIIKLCGMSNLRIQPE